MRQTFKFFIIIYLSLIANANETPPEQGSKPEGAASTGGPNSYEKLEQDKTKEWVELVSEIATLKAKIKSKEESIKEAIHHKNSAHSKADAEHAVTSLLTDHKELTKLQEEYNTKTQLLKYRYPEVGISQKRNYERVEIRSLDEYEKMLTIEQVVKRAVSKAKTHYGVKEDPKIKDQKKPKEEVLEKNHLALPVILKK